GKAAVFGTAMRWFESSRPSQFSRNSCMFSVILEIVAIIQEVVAAMRRTGESHRLFPVISAAISLPR
ncbi:MAG: hypothetical protein KDJ90_02830, partial [Nitratireductor sp.]|nr:hypothetical protein [Nitratireductor sp.]